MKKYKLVCKDSDKIKFENIFDAKVDAIEAMNEEIDTYNDKYNLTEEEGLSPFDFTMDVVEVEDKKEDNGIEKDFEDAREKLDSFNVTSDEAAKHFDSLAQLIRNANPRHIKALIALNKLFTIAEKWNKEDGFVPDFSNKGQWKYFPWFEYSKESAGFVFAHTSSAASFANALFGSRLCFKSESRAEEFGKKYVDLYNEVFLLND
nr:MAG: hypothetical protein [Bacteriophage sp.]